MPSALTRRAIEQMNEATFRREVLVPLFTAMGFEHVTDHHHANEHGKDIVMWRNEPPAGRVDYGVVVKVGSITGKTSGTGSAADVAAQIRECFGSPYLDIQSMQQRTPSNCYVVTSGPINPHARAKLAAHLGEQMLRHVIFFDGDRIWGEVVKHLRGRVIWAHLAAASDGLGALSEYFEVRATAGKGGASLEISPKPGAPGDAPPLVFTAKFSFPDTPAGNAARDALHSAIATGQEVKIEKPFITELQVPELLAGLLGDMGEHPDALVFKPATPTATITANLEVRSLDGGSGATISSLMLQAIAAGTEELSFGNVAQKTPWHFMFRLNLQTKDATTQASFDLAGANVKQQLEALRLVEALAAGGRLTLTQADTGLRIYVGNFPSGVFPPAEVGIVNLLDKLFAIQIATGVPLSLPARSLTKEEVQAVYETAYIIEHGTIDSTFRSLVVEVAREKVPMLLANFGPESLQVVTVVEDASVTLFDTRVSLGQRVGTIPGAVLAPGEADRIQKELEANPAQASVLAKLVAPPGTDAIIEYPRWKKGPNS